MQRSTVTRGLVIAVVAAFSFGSSGALLKPMFDAGWSPVAVVAARSLIGGFALLPFALVAVRGHWPTVWRSRWRILALSVTGVSGTLLFYFLSIERIPVATGILIEYLAPLLLVGVVWVTTRRMPHAVVLIGSAVALAGLILVVSPFGGGTLDPLGIVFALIAMIGCAAYYVIVARPTNGLPPVVLASFGVILGGLTVLGIAATGILPFEVATRDVAFAGTSVAWWVPLVTAGVLSTAIGFATSIKATEILGSRIASFVGLLEVVTAALYAWLLLGENLSIPQVIGGALILAGIAFVRSDKPVVELAETSGGELVGVEDGVAVPLLGQEPLPVLGEVLVDGVARDEGVEVRR